LPSIQIFYSIRFDGDKKTPFIMLFDSSLVDIILRLTIDLRDLIFDGYFNPVVVTFDVLPPSDDNDDDYDPLLGEADLFLSNDSIPPGIENFANDPEGNIRFLEELLIDDSILSHESFDSSFEDSPLIPRPPPEPPDVETDTGEEISVVMNDKDEDVYSSFILDYPPEIEVILCRIYVRFSRSSYPLIDFSLGKSISVIYIAYPLFSRLYALDIKHWGQCLSFSVG
nr:hypothetical protein [Tanacetum cinerariifolium]